MNRDEFEAFLRACGGDILSFCKYLTKNTYEAEDLCQDTFICGYERMDESLTDYSEAKKFFLGLATRLWKDRKRKFARRHRLEEEQILPEAWYDIEIAGEDDTPEKRFIQEEEKAIVRDAVDCLAEKKRIVVLLYYAEGMKENEIAEILHIPQGTVKSRLHQAKTELVAMLSKKL